MSRDIPDDDPRKWEFTLHADVKHRIQQRYLRAWLPILGTHHSPLLLFDGFAGRGHYKTGEPGSPLIFWECAIEAVAAGRPKRVQIDCVELHPNNFRELSSTVADLEHDSVEIRPLEGEFAEQARRKAAALRAGGQVPPVFWTADPYGFRGVPLDVIRELMQFKRSEVMITFMVRDIRRFIGEKSHEAPLTELFGGDAWRACLQLEGEETREQKLLLTYSDLIRDSIARFATPFKVFEDERLQTLYYLIHLTNEPLGMRKMKDAMVKTSPDMTFWPVTIRDPEQIALDVEESPPYPSLQEHLLETYRDRAIEFEALLNEDYPRGVWVEREYRLAIVALDKAGRVEIDRSSREAPGARAPTGLNLKDSVFFGAQQLILE